MICELSEVIDSGDLGGRDNSSILYIHTLKETVDTCIWMGPTVTQGDYPKMVCEQSDFTSMNCTISTHHTQRKSH